MTRQEKIQLLFEDYMDSIYDDHSVAEYMVMDGFKGFKNYTDIELDEAIDDAGLLPDEDE